MPYGLLGSPRAVPTIDPYGYDADAARYIEEVERADGQRLGLAVRLAINAFVVGCKTDGIWSAIKASCILMGARTLSGALTPLVGAAPANVNFVSGDYSRTLGIRGDGTSKFINAGYLSNADPQNDAHACVWVTGPPATNQISPIFASGWFDGNGRSAVWNSSSGGNANGASGEAIATCHGGLYQTSINRFTGAWAVSRSSSSQFVFRPGGSTDITVTAASGTPSANNIRILGVAVGGGLFSNARASFYSIGRAINISSMSSRLSTLATAIGAAIP